MNRLPAKWRHCSLVLVQRALFNHVLLHYTLHERVTGATRPRTNVYIFMPITDPRADRRASDVCASNRNTTRMICVKRETHTRYLMRFKLRRYTCTYRHINTRTHRTSIKLLPSASSRNVRFFSCLLLARNPYESRTVVFRVCTRLVNREKIISSGMGRGNVIPAPRPLQSPHFATLDTQIIIT
jgi:hypothetical protein